MSPGVISSMNPGPYRPLYLCREGPTNRPLPRGSSSRPMVARLVRYGPVRQKKTFLEEPPVGNEGVVPGLVDGEADILQVRILG